MSADDDRYGFRWGNVVVKRIAEHTRERVMWRVLMVRSQRHKLVIYASKDQGDIRVWLDGKELKGGDAS